MQNHGNYIVDHGKSWKNHGIEFSNFCGNPERISVDKLNCFATFGQKAQRQVFL